MKNLFLIILFGIYNTSPAQGAFGSIFYSEIQNSNLTQNDTIEIVVTTYMHQYDQPGGAPCHNLISVTSKDSLDHLVFDLLYDMTSPAIYTPCFQNDTISHFPFQITTKEIVIMSYAIDAALDTSRFTSDTIVLAELGIGELESQGIQSIYYDYQNKALIFQSETAKHLQALRVFNSMGQLIWGVQKIESGHSYPLPLARGIYLLTWELNGNSGSTRIIVP
mgnify:CR=1 FL=1